MFIYWASEIKPLIWCFQTFLNMEPQLLSQLPHSKQKASVFDCVYVCPHCPYLCVCGAPFWRHFIKLYLEAFKMEQFWLQELLWITTVIF